MPIDSVTQQNIVASPDATSTTIPKLPIASPNFGTTVITPDKAQADIGQIKTTLNQAKTDMSAQAQLKAQTQPSTSIVDYLGSKGQPTDFASRTALAQKYGIQNYTGTAAQNTQLLGILQTQPEPKPEVPATTPTIPATLQGLVSANNNQPYTFSKNADGSVSYFDWKGNQLNTNPVGGDQYKTNPEQTPGFGSILLPRTQQATTAPSGATDSISQFVSQMNATNNKIDQAYTNYSNQLSQIQQGTFPLTPAQQAQVNALKQQFEDLKAEQITANKNYEGSVTAAGIVSGRSKYAPEIDTGLIKNAVDEGISKIQKIDTDQAAAVSKLEQGFMDKDLQMIQDAYSAFNSYAKQRQDSLKAITDAVQTHEKEVRDFDYKVVQDTIKNTLENDKFTFEQKQGAVKNAIDQANLKINERKQLLAESQLKLQQDLLGKLNQASGIQVKDSKTNVVSPVAQQEYLKQFPVQVQDNIKAIAEYRAPLSVFPTRLYKGQMGYTQSDYLSMASHYAGEDFNVANYPIRQKFMSNWTSGGMAALRSSSNAATQHLIELTNAANSLNNSDIKVLNGLKNWAKDQTGNPRVTAFQTAADAFSGEYAKFIVTNLGSVQGATQEDRQTVLDLLSTKIAPDQIKAFGTTAANLMRDRMAGVQDIYAGVMGKLPDAKNGIMLPSTQEKLGQLKQLGIDTDFSYVMPQNQYSNLTPEQLLNTGTASSTQGSDNISIINTIMNMVNQTQ